MQYQRALNRLAAYNAPHRPDQSHDFGEALGGGFSKAFKASKGGGDKDKAVAPTHDPAMYNKYVQATGAGRGMAQAGMPMLDNQSVLEHADKAVHDNQLAEDARINGVFTPVGLDAASKRAEANGADRFKLKRVVGLAGTPVPGMAPGMGTGGF